MILLKLSRARTRFITFRDLQEQLPVDILPEGLALGRLRLGSRPSDYAQVTKSRVTALIVVTA